MKAKSRPQYYRIKKIVDMVRESPERGYLPNRSDFQRELEVSARTLARDLDFLRDEERAPIEYDATQHGYRLTDETCHLPPVRISRKEAFSFALARKLLAAFEGTPLDMDMRSVLAKIAESLEGEYQRGTRLAQRSYHRAGRGPRPPRSHPLGADGWPDRTARGL